MYSYADLNDYIHEYMDANNHKTGDKYYINLSFVLSTYRVLIVIDNNYRLDIRTGEFSDLIGFEKKLLTQTEYGSRLPSITNSVDMIYINTDAVTINILNGVNTNTLAVIIC